MESDEVRRFEVLKVLCLRHKSKSGLFLVVGDIDQDAFARGTWMQFAEGFEPGKLNPEFEK